MSKRRRTHRPLSPYDTEKAHEHVLKDKVSTKLADLMRRKGKDAFEVLRDVIALENHLEAERERWRDEQLQSLLSKPSSEEPTTPSPPESLQKPGSKHQPSDIGSRIKYYGGPEPEPT